MKNYVVPFLFCVSTFFCLIEESHAQANHECIHKEFRYRFYEYVGNGRWNTVWACENYPDDSFHSNPATKGMKGPIGWSSYGYPNPTTIAWTGHPARTATGALPCSVSDESGLESCLTNSFSTWLSFCTNLSSYFVITHDVNHTVPSAIVFKASSDPNNFYNSGEDFAESSTGVPSSTSGGPNTPPSTDLQNFRGVVLINYTPDFLSKSVLCYPCPPPENCDLGGAKPVNFCRVLAHEVGHALGLGDYTNPPCNAESGDVNDLMFGDYNGSCSGPCWTVTDQCYFIQQYCPVDGQIVAPSLCDHSGEGGASSVRNPKGIEINGFNIFPNPAKQTVTIQFVNKDFERTEVGIFDVIGNQIREFVFLHPEGLIEENLSLFGIEKGNYYIRISNNEIRYTKKLIIN